MEYSLTFYYGTMNSSKTANLLMNCYSLRKNNKKVLLCKPFICKDGNKDDYITSRVGLYEKPDILIYSDRNIDIKDEIDIMLIDEAQFLSKKNVEQLRDIAYKIPVICYGLLTDYRSKLFTGSKRLLELSDNIKEQSNPPFGNCSICLKHKAIINSKYNQENGKIIKSGDNIIDIGAEEKYKAVCWQCW